MKVWFIGTGVYENVQFYKPLINSTSNENQITYMHILSA